MFPTVSSLDGLALAVSEDLAIDPTDEDAVLQLCVSLPTPEPLTTGPRYTWGRMSRRKRGAWHASATIAFYSTIFVVAFVLVDRYCGAYLSSIY